MLLMRLQRKIRFFLKDTRGAVTTEYVLLCVMLAAGAMMMVISFSRAVARQFALVSYAMTGYSSELIGETQEAFRNDQKDDAVVAGIYSDYMHGEKVDDLKR